MKEKWKKVKEWPYEVSSFGRIRRMKKGKSTFEGKIINPYSDCGKGYLKIDLYYSGRRKNTYLHKIVAEAFLGKRPKDCQVNHIDGNKENPRVDNLEYVNQSDNMKHAFKIGLKSHRGEQHPRSKLFERDVKKIRKMHKTGNFTQVEIAKMFNVTPVNISMIVRRINWSHI